jgi:RNA 2',3'-cyclic 3'-phosphodiesterase
VRRVAREGAPFTTGLRAAGAFPTAARARVLWLGWGEGAQQVSRLQTRLAEALAAGFDVERRRFTPHVTLARARAAVDLRATVDALRDWRSASWEVTAVDVMASRLTPQGAVHTRLERCAFDAGGAPDDAGTGGQ